VVGIAGAQYTWFAAIAKSNVALATFVQYSAVAMTASWQMLRRQVRPTPRRLAAVAAAATGVWLLAAGVPGGLHASRADQAGVLLAVISAVAYSFYLLGSARLVRETGARPATAWGLSIGSLPLLVIFPPWTAHPSGDPVVVAALTAFVAVAATAIAFSLSQASLRHITPTEFAVTSTLEPALAAVAAAIFLGDAPPATIRRRRPDHRRRPAARSRRAGHALAGRRCAVMLAWISIATHAGCGQAGQTPTSTGSPG